MTTDPSQAGLPPYPPCYSSAATDEQNALYFEWWRGYHRGRKDAAPDASGGGWISTAERLPEPGDMVIVCFEPDAYVMPGRLNDDGGWDGGGWSKSLKASHWQPLPAPPDITRRATATDAGKA